MTDWNHDALLRDLADLQEEQGKIVFCDTNIGPAGSPRPDILAINKSYHRWNPTVYEVKTSRSDFHSDVTSGKWMAYRAVASSITFAVPAGLVKKAEVPDRCGLIVRHEKVWRHIKKPVVEVIDNFEQHTWMALLMSLDGWSKQATLRPRAAEFTAASRDRHELGDEIRTYLNDKGAAEYQVESTKKSAERILEQARNDAKRIVDKAKERNPYLLERLKEAMVRHGIPFQNSYSFKTNVEGLIECLERRFDAEVAIKEARTAIARAAKAVGCD